MIAGMEDAEREMLRQQRAAEGWHQSHIEAWERDEDKERAQERESRNRQRQTRRAHSWPLDTPAGVPELSPFYDTEGRSVLLLDWQTGGWGTGRQAPHTPNSPYSEEDLEDKELRL